MDRRGFATRENLAAAVGTCAIETASTFMPVREAFWLDEDWRRRNLRYYPYYGRGDIQLTWRDAYLAASAEVGIDLVANPDAALDPENAAIIFAWFWCVYKPGITAAAARRDWREVRRLVQGGSDGLDRLVQIANGLLAS